MGMATTLTRQQLVDLQACQRGLEWFDSRATDGVITYPNGFDETEIKRLGTKNPFFFQWMARHGFIPGVDEQRAGEIVVELRKAPR